jgi:hypothetical protein
MTSQTAYTYTLRCVCMKLHPALNSACSDNASRVRAVWRPAARSLGVAMSSGNVLVVSRATSIFYKPVNDSALPRCVDSSGCSHACTPPRCTTARACNILMCAGMTCAVDSSDTATNATESLDSSLSQVLRWLDSGPIPAYVSDTVEQ